MCKNIKGMNKMKQIFKSDKYRDENIGCENKDRKLYEIL